MVEEITCIQLSAPLLLERNTVNAVKLCTSAGQAGRVTPVRTPHAHASQQFQPPRHQ